VIADTVTAIGLYFSLMAVLAVVAYYLRRY
jgi:hypothetical protein